MDAPAAFSTHVQQPESFSQSSVVWVYPELADDTYATVGFQVRHLFPLTTGPWMRLWFRMWTSQSPFSKRMTLRCLVQHGDGGPVVVLNTASNGLPDENNRVWMQVTSGGPLSGQLNVQVFPLGWERMPLKDLPLDGAGEFEGTEFALVWLHG